MRPVGEPAGLWPVAVGGVLAVAGPPMARPARARSNNPAGTRSSRLGAVGWPGLGGGRDPWGRDRGASRSGRVRSRLVRSWLVRSWLVRSRLMLYRLVLSGRVL